MAMGTETLEIHVPEGLYHRLERLAALTKRPIESLIVQTLSSSIPPLPDDLSPETRDALLALEDLSDDALWQMMNSTFPQERYERLSELREKRREGPLTDEERETLDQL